MIIPEKNYFRVSEVASLLDEPQSNVYYWIKIGRIKVVRIGEKLKIGRGEVSRMIRERRA